jgi:hypothetical protein
MQNPPSAITQLSCGAHYQKTHMNRCSECQKNFPDEHFLHLHIAENHDPINASKRDKGEKTVGLG